jgi:hypothetical protein
MSLLTELIAFPVTAAINILLLRSRWAPLNQGELAALRFSALVRTGVPIVRNAIDHSGCNHLKIVSPYDPF